MRIKGPRGNQETLFLQLKQVVTMCFPEGFHFFQWTSITNDGKSVDTNSLRIETEDISNNVEQAHQTVRRYAGDRAEFAIIFYSGDDDTFQREPGVTVTHYEILDFKRVGHGLSFHPAAEWFGRPYPIST